MIFFTQTYFFSKQLFLVKKMIQSMTSNCHTLVLKKLKKKCNNLGTFTQKILFLDYNKPKKCEFEVMDCFCSPKNDFLRLKMFFFRSKMTFSQTIFRPKRETLENSGKNCFDQQKTQAKTGC